MDLATTHPYLLKAWSINNAISPREVTAGSHKKVLWVCDKGHEWEAQIVSVIMNVSGCPVCAEKVKKQKLPV